MGFLGSLIGEVAKGFFSAVGNFIQSMFQRADEQQLGQQEQKAVDAEQATVQANQATQTEAVEAQAEADAPKTQTGVVDELNKGTF